MFSKWYYCVILYVYLSNHGTKSANILVLDPIPVHSHFTIPFKLAKALADRGHQVTCINAFPQKTKIKNFVDIPVVENIPLLDNLTKDLMARGDLSIFEELKSIFDTSAVLVNHTIHHKNVQDLLKSPKKFDLVISEVFFLEALVGFGYLYNAPVILISALAANTINNYIFANPEPASYVPHMGALTTKHMNFWERLQNWLKGTVFKGFIHLYHLPLQRKIFQSYINDVELDDVLYNSSLMFTNSHPSFAPANPLLPNIIEIGGFHVTPTNSLPKDLKKFLDDSKDGFVLFSMGSMLKSQDLKPGVLEGILTAFSKIKQNVLWKFTTNLTQVPENVKIMKWIPQVDVLGHPNIRAFITHGGRLSNIEAIYYGVPIIGIPVFGDQPGNIIQAVSDGYALEVKLKSLSEETLASALHEILNNPKYKQNAKKRSEVLHDQPMKPMDTAIFWVEHVLRHKGVPHLRSAGLDLSWCQREMVDIFGTLVAIISFVLFVLYLSIRWFCYRKAKISISKKRQ